MNFFVKFLQITNVKFNGNPSIGNWVFPYRRVDRQAWHSLKVTLCNFVNALKKSVAKRTSTVQMPLDCWTTWCPLQLVCGKGPENHLTVLMCVKLAETDKNSLSVTVKLFIPCFFKNIEKSTIVHAANNIA